MTELHCLQVLLAQTLTLGMVVLVLVLSRPVRLRALGAAASHAMWLTMPLAALSSVLPAWQLASAPTELLKLKAAGQSHWNETLSAMGLALSWPIETVAQANHQPVVTALLVIWASGLLLCLIDQIVASRRLRQALSSSSSILGLPVCRTKAGTGPALLGVLRPHLCLPLDFEQRFSPAEQRLILVHELAHWQRRDPWVNLLAWLLCCVHWFNPLMWWALRQMRTEQELAVDARVLQSHGPRAKAPYAAALLKAQGLRSLGQGSPLLACSWQADNPLMERVTMLKHHDLPVWRRRTGLALSLCLSLAGAGAVQAVQTQAPKPAPPGQTGYSLIEMDADVQVDGVKRRSVRITQMRGNWSWVHIAPRQSDLRDDWMVKVQSDAVEGDKFRLELVVFRGDPDAQAEVETDGLKGRHVKLVAKPVLVVAAGQAGRIEIGNEDGTGMFALDIKPRWISVDAEHWFIKTPVVDR